MTELTEIIARRALTAGSVKLVVEIAKPVEDEGDFRCAYSLNGDGGIHKTSYAIGMDAVQALQLAMKKIGTDIDAIGRRLGEPFSWLPDEPGVSGFA